MGMKSHGRRVIVAPSATHCKAVLFDFDGTLADSYPAIAASVNYVRAAHGLSPLEEDEVRRHVGRGPAYLLEHTVPGGDPPADVARYRAHHPTVMRTLTHLLPGVADALAALQKAGLRLAVCSNKPVAFTRDLLATFGIAGRFQAVLGPEDVPRPKPAPDMLLAGLRRLDVVAADALYVGDMTVDIQTARAAGVRVWVVPTGSDDRAALEAAHPDRLLDGFADLVPGLAGAS
jgi:phosphoglycolate phosphatase